MSPSQKYFILFALWSTFVYGCSAKNTSVEEVHGNQPETNMDEHQEQLDPQNNSPKEQNHDSSQTTENFTVPKPPPRLQNNTEKLVKEGILEELPSSIPVEQELLVTFRTMYPNGCWMQSEPIHEIDTSKKTITHTYTTNYEGEGRMCTMGFKHGGFQKPIVIDEIGIYTGTIIVDENVRTTYTIEVTSN